MVYQVRNHLITLLFLDGVYVYRDNRPPRFRRVKTPDKSELEELVQLIFNLLDRFRRDHPTHNRQVEGSNPSGPTILLILDGFLFERASDYGA